VAFASFCIQVETVLVQDDTFNIEACLLDKEGLAVNLQ